MRSAVDTLPTKAQEDEDSWKEKPSDVSTENTLRSRQSETIQNLKKQGKRNKEKGERQMQEALNEMAMSHTKQKTEVTKSPNRRLPVLKYDEEEPSKCGKCVGLVYNNDMLKHRSWKTIDYGIYHPERPERILKPIERLNETDTLSKVYLMKGREATLEEICAIHLEYHVSTIASITGMEQEDIELEQEKYDSIYLCKYSYYCALLSCGSTLSLVQMVVGGMLKSGFALVRPPGHHAEVHTARGFCIFNNVAIAAKEAQRLAVEKGIVSHERSYKILILDWDVHHGNGIQKMFYGNSSVLYISLHRYEHGYFYPSSEIADYDQVGIDDGAGFNINIAWSDASMGDPEYYLAFENIVMPVAEEFEPHLVLVSSGFDAGKGDPLGGFKVTPHMYGYMTHRLQSLADGKVAIVLEGGYNLKTVSESVVACTTALLHFNDPNTDSNRSKYTDPPKLKSPNSPGIRCVLNTMDSILPYWRSLQNKIEEVRQLDKEINAASVNKLTEGFETLVLNEDAISGDSGHRYGTRAKSRSSRQSDDSRSTTDESLSEANDWAQLEFSPPESIEASTPHDHSNVPANTIDPQPNYEHVVTPATSSTSADATAMDNDLPATSLFVNVFKPGHDGIDNIVDTSGQVNGATAAPDLVGACGFTMRTEKIDECQLAAILHAIGAGDTENMSLEDKLAIAQAGLSDDESGFTIPRDDCAHVKMDHIEFGKTKNLRMSLPCSVCGHEKENWTCLACGQVFCGRFINGHMLHHFKLSGHPITLSHSDLSFWCYNCDSYVNNFSIEPLKEIYKRVHYQKHGTETLA